MDSYRLCPRHAALSILCPDIQSFKFLGAALVPRASPRSDASICTKKRDRPVSRDRGNGSRRPRSGISTLWSAGRSLPNHLAARACGMPWLNAFNGLPPGQYGSAANFENLR